MGVKHYIAGALILFLIYLGWHIYTDEIKQEVIISYETGSENFFTLADSNTQKQVETTKKTLQQDKDIEPVNRDDFIEVIYDQDPVVNASMLLNENILCIQQLSDGKNHTEYLQRFKAMLDDNQQKFYKGFTKYCQKLNKQHPEYHLTDKTKLNQQKNNAQATSLWGKIIKGEQKVDDLTDYEITGLLRSGDINILTQAPKYLREYYQKVIHWDLESVLQNHQYDYVEYIQNYAHQLYLCQQGADCSEYSSTMVMLCYLNSKGCGLDYNNYIQEVLTSGQQADVALALDYLKSQY